MRSATRSASSAPESAGARRWVSRLWGQPPSGDPAAHYLRHPERLTAGNRVRVLNGGGEAYPAMLEAIAGARSEVLLATYIVREDTVGERFRAALVERARAGVRVRFCYDAVGCLGTVSSAWFDALREAGCDVLEYHPIAPWRPRWALNRRNHQKLLVVDGELGFTGGLNLGAEYAPAPEGEGWIDVHARIEGPVADELADVFARAWAAGGARPFVPVRGADPVFDDGMRVQTLDSVGLRRRQEMNLAWRHAIGGAQRSITIACAYFIPDRRLRRAMRAAVRRGVRVDVVVPESSDVPIVQAASRHLFRRLLRSGVRLHELGGPVLHAKAAVVDRRWSIISSYNLDSRSILHNLEAGVVVFDEHFGQQLQHTLTDLRDRAREVTLADVATRSPLDHLVNWMAYIFRYWL